MNFVTVMGNLGFDPEVRFTSTGKKVTTLRVAARSRKGGAEVTIWWRVTIWGEQFDKLISYLKKGSSIVAFGEFQKPDIFNDREGKPQVGLEMWASSIHFTPFNKSEREGAADKPKEAVAESPPVNPYMAQQPVHAMPSGETFDDEVPF